MKKFNLAIKFLYYLLTSKNRHGIHSPFVYDLIDKIIYDKTPFQAFHKIEKIRKGLRNDKREIVIEDYGAGSTVYGSNRRKICGIIAHSVKSKKYAQLLFRIVKHFKSRTVLELGTSLGITTLYLAEGQSNGKVYTIEGCPQIAAVAVETFKKAGMKNIQMINGEFENILPELLQQLPVLDVVFFDGNHRKEATLAYFEMCIKKAGNSSVFVFDDIYWSDEMEEAWKIIRAHPEVTVTIDLFSMGLVFFRKEQPRQHFRIRY